VILILDYFSFDCSRRWQRTNGTHKKPGQLFFNSIFTPTQHKTKDFSDPNNNNNTSNNFCKPTMRNFSHLSSNDIAALLRSLGNAPTPSMSRAINGNALDALFGGSASAPAQASSSEAALITLLIMKQREDQEKEFLIRQLMNAPLQLQQQHQPQTRLSNIDALDLALLIQESQQSLRVAPPVAPMTTSALSLLGSASASASTKSLASSNDFDAFALANILQARTPTTSLSMMSLGAAKAPPSSMAREIPNFASAASLATAAINNGNSTSMASSSLPSTGMFLAPADDRRRKGRTGTFPQKLHQMLSDLEQLEGGKDIASFLNHGRSFAIHKPRDFVKFVMGKHFRMSRFSSFQRQLNLYDFQRITEGPDKGSYYHELFVQGRPILSTMMKRNKIKGIKGKNGGVGKDSKKKVCIPAASAMNNSCASHTTGDESETA
jgi:HSF-type DNA-binding